MSAITITQETIDPATAAAWLTKNSKNRTVRESLVNQMSRDIKEGRWVLNGESIKLAGDGSVIDGQHRLTAVVATGKPITTIVVRGLDATTQDTVDIGARRTFGDNLKIAGEKHYTVLASATRTAWMLENLGTAIPGKSNPSRTELAEYFRKNPDLRHWAAIGTQVVHSAVRLPAATMGVGYLMSRIDVDRAKEFWRQILENDSEKGSPIFALREQLIRDRTASHHSSVPHRLALIIKAWNAWVEGRSVAQLTWRPGIEQYPKLSEPVE